MILILRFLFYFFRLCSFLRSRFSSCRERIFVTITFSGPKIITEPDAKARKHIMIHRIEYRCGQRIVKLSQSLQIITQQKPVSKLQIEIPPLCKFHFKAHTKRNSECEFLPIASLYAGIITPPIPAKIKGEYLLLNLL